MPNSQRVTFVNLARLTTVFLQCDYSNRGTWRKIIESQRFFFLCALPFPERTLTSLTGSESLLALAWASNLDSASCLMRTFFSDGETIGHPDKLQNEGVEATKTINKRRVLKTETHRSNQKVTQKLKQDVCSNTGNKHANKLAFFFLAKVHCMFQSQIYFLKTVPCPKQFLSSSPTITLLLPLSLPNSLTRANLLWVLNWPLECPVPSQPGVGHL